MKYPILLDVLKITNSYIGTVFAFAFNYQSASFCEYLTILELSMTKYIWCLVIPQKDRDSVQLLKKRSQIFNCGRGHGRGVMIFLLKLFSSTFLILSTGIARAIYYKIQQEQKKFLSVFVPEKKLYFIRS